MVSRLIQRFILFRRPVVCSAILAATCFLDLEGLSLPRNVFLENLSRNDILTDAFHDPCSVRKWLLRPSILEQFQVIAMDVRHTEKLPRVCVVAFELDYRGFLCFSVCWVLLCIGTGGICGHNSLDFASGGAIGGGLGSLVAVLYFALLHLW